MVAGVALIAGLGGLVALHLLEPSLAITWSFAHLGRAAGLRPAALLSLFSPLVFYDTAVQWHFESEWLVFGPARTRGASTGVAQG